MRVLYPKNFMALPDADLSRRHSHYVLSQGARLYHKRSFNDGTFEQAIDQLLAQD